MAFEPLNAYGAYSRAFDALLLMAWILLLAFMQLFPAENILYFSGFAVVLTVVSLRWSFVEGSAVLLLVSWIFGAFSKMPSAILFWALFAVFCVLRIVVESLQLRQRISVGLAFAFAALGFYLLQLFFIHQVVHPMGLSIQIFGKIVLASSVEGFVGFLLGPSFLAWISSR